MFNIFSSFIHTDFFSLDIKKIKKEIFNIRSKDKGRTRSNYNGWQSQDFSIADKNFQSLFDNIYRSVKKIEKNLSISKELRLRNLWCNINGLGSFNRPHSHPGGVVSGVYYVSIPKNSGSIVFLNRNLDSFYNKNVKNYNEYNSSTWIIKPEENQCVLFPSYLEHYVEPNLNKKERISISFNYGF
jgi:uncharacterized protein (TIGR02466 family)